jgi:Flp pilus assembly pilin Flp
MTRLRILLSRLRDDSGVSAIEFALIAPILILLMMASVELQRYLRIDRQLANSAENVASLIAQRPGPLTGWNISEDFDSTFQTFPEAAIRAAPGPWFNAMGYMITHAAFSTTVAGCTANCAYKANVAWLWGRGTGAPGMTRRCGELTAAPAGAAPSGSTLPATMFGPGSIIIVDLSFDFVPVFGASFISPIQMFKQAYAFPRFSSTWLNASQATLTTTCPGYS